MAQVISARIVAICASMLACNYFARADVILDYPIVSSTLESPLGLFFSDFNQNNQAAARFSVTNGSEILSAVWYGGYLNTTADPTGPLDFVIRIFEHGSDGFPVDTPMFETSVIAMGIATPHTAVSFGGGSGLLDVFKYEVTLPSVWLTADSIFWISIVEDTPDLVWFWAPSANVGGLTTARRFTDASPWRDTGGRPPAVSLLGEVSCLGDVPGVTVGTVDVSDLLDLLGGWGPNPGHPADFNGDDLVNVTDLLTLLGAWGQCP